MVIVVGAGIGGLCAAIWLAARGRRVRVIEGADRPGGKAGAVVLDGVEVDTGPSVLTLPDVFADVLAAAGRRFEDHVELVRPDPSFRYVFPGGPEVDVFVEPERTVASVERTLGGAAAAELASFLAYAAAIWAAAGPRFVRGPAPTVGGLLSLAALRELAAIDPLHTMAGAVRARIRDPRLADILLRYATYVGSDPRRAPATLHCIAHVELALGGFGVRGGIGALVVALVQAAEALGVEIVTGVPVERLRTDGRVVRGVETAAGPMDADAVVANADVGALFGQLLPEVRAPLPPSTSGWTAILRAPRRERVAHTVLFPERYADEFRDLFDARRAPLAPTVYLCAQERAHRRVGWADAEPVFAMANAPAGCPDAQIGPLRDAVLARADAHGLGGPIVWERTPADLARRFPGSDGALYGPASNSPFSAFRRAPNRVERWRGLYLASGSAHPGGGLPLCALSGRAAADALIEDLGEGR